MTVRIVSELHSFKNNYCRFSRHSYSCRKQVNRHRQHHHSVIRCQQSIVRQQHISRFGQIFKCAVNLHELHKMKSCLRSTVQKILNCSHLIRRSVNTVMWLCGTRRRCTKIMRITKRAKDLKYLMSFRPWRYCTQMMLFEQFWNSLTYSCHSDAEK